MDRPAGLPRPWRRTPATASPLPAAGRVLIVGARRDSRRVARSLSQGPWPGMPVVGFIDAGHPRYSGSVGRGRQLAVHPESDPVPVLGRLDRLAELITRSGATHLVVAAHGSPARRIAPALDHLINSDVHVHWIKDRAPRGVLAGSPPGTTRGPSPWRWERVAKRAVDILAALLGLIILAPLFAAVALAIRLTSAGPVFYKQVRVGQGGRPFRMWKFRSMGTDAEGQTGPIWASNRDDRCTAVGAWLRRTNIDELPQLINVLVGEMSLVGPRPERPVFVEQFRSVVPDYDLRHAVPGGMTGWAQVHGWRGRTSLRKRVQYDIDYIQRWSLLLDVRVLLMTIQHVAYGKTSWVDAGAGSTLRGLARRRRR